MNLVLCVLLLIFHYTANGLHDYCPTSLLSTNPDFDNYQYDEIVQMREVDEIKMLIQNQQEILDEFDEMFHELDELLNAMIKSQNEFRNYMNKLLIMIIVLYIAIFYMMIQNMIDLHNLNTLLSIIINNLDHAG